MTSSRPSLFPGVALIVLGIIFLLPNFTALRMRDLWPVFVLGPGLYFSFLFMADRKNYGVLMPATILNVIGILFFVCVIGGWDLMHTLWPLFIIAPGLGFFLMYFFGPREKGLLIPASIVTAVGCFFLIGINDIDYFWPVILIALGVFLLLRRNKDGQAPSQHGETTPGS